MSAVLEANSLWSCVNPACIELDVFINTVESSLSKVLPLFPQHQDLNVPSFIVA